MEKPNIIDKRPVRLEDLSRPGYIPFLGGRPVRESVISKDDLLNLTITLNTTDTIDDFIKSFAQ
jgi:hypothetical protein